MRHIFLLFMGTLSISLSAQKKTRYSLVSQHAQKEKHGYFFG